MKKNWSGERLETFIYSRDAIEHLHRYAIASNYAKDKVVLDIASGEGYGSNLLSKIASYVYGVDIDKNTVEKAKFKYKSKNLKFLSGSTSRIPIEDNSIDLVVSYETIEHHEEHDQMMFEIKRVLKDDGMLIISSPDKLYYTDLANFNNEHHKKELYKGEFKSLIHQNFSFVQLLTQKFVKSGSIIQDDELIFDLDVFSGNYTIIKELNIAPLYVIAIASNKELNKQCFSFFDGSEILIKDVVNKFNKSNSYKIGHFILLPFKKIKRLIYRLC